MTEPSAAPRTAQDVIALLHDWLDTDEPLVEAVGDTLEEFQRVEMQELARRVVGTVINVLERYVPAAGE